MKKLSFIFILTVIFFNGASAQTNSTETNAPTLNWSEFESDGCTGFPDGNYRDCCVAHDREYFAGGSLKARWRSDIKLFQCVWAKPKFYNKFIAPVIWLGVRAGGIPYLRTAFSWGFGKKKKKTSARIPKKTRN